MLRAALGRLLECHPKDIGSESMHNAELVDAWPVERACDAGGRLIRLSASQVLGAFRPHGALNGCCYVFDLVSRSAGQERWMQPAWVTQQWQQLQIVPNNAIRDLAACTTASGQLAALTTDGGYGSCWHLGSERGFVLESELGIQRVSFSPCGRQLAIGTGAFVLDRRSTPVAEVQIWDVSQQRCLTSLRLPGACVTGLLWLDAIEAGLEGFRFSHVGEKTADSFTPCPYFIHDTLDEMLVVTTLSKDQSRGYVALLSVPVLTLVEIAEIPEDCFASSPICFRQPNRLSAGGLRLLDQFHDPEVGSSFDLLRSEQRTATPSSEPVWLGGDLSFQLSTCPVTGGRLAQIWRSLP